MGGTNRNKQIKTKKQKMAGHVETKKRKIETFKITLDGTKKFEDAYFLYEPMAFGASESYELMRKISETHTFNQNQVVVCGRLCDTPRKEVLLGRVAGVRYHYSGNYMTTEKWCDELDAMCTLLSHRYGVQLNSCLANLYRNGCDGVGKHADDEEDMADDTVVTVSLGAARFFRIFERTKEKKKLIQVNLRHASVHVQKKGMQKVRVHEIPKQLKIEDERISLTFRNLSPPKE